MQKTVSETEAKQIALDYVQKQDSGARAEINSVERQNVWVMETQTKEAKGTQYANVTISGIGEVKDYRKTRFQSGSVTQRIKSKLRSIFSHGKQEVT